MEYISLAAFGGGLASGLLGWLHAGGKFDGKKFFASGLRAVVAGGVAAVAHSQVIGSPTWVEIITAFVAGAGVDVLGHRLAKK